MFTNERDSKQTAKVNAEEVVPLLRQLKNHGFDLDEASKACGYTKIQPLSDGKYSMRAKYALMGLLSELGERPHLAAKSTKNHDFTQEEVIFMIQMVSKSTKQKAAALISKLGVLLA